MKKYLLSTVAALSVSAFASTSHAADLVDYPVTMNWSGSYLGLQSGFGVGDGEQDILTDGLGFLDTPYGPSSIGGGLIGVQAGYDYQMSNIVLGVNAEINRSAIRGFFNNIAGNDGYETNVEWFGSVRGRIGFVPSSSPDFMAYVTGGLAFAEIDTINGDLDGPNSAPFFDCASTGCAKSSDTELGYTVGAGLAWQFQLQTGHTVVFGAEYAYYDFGNSTVNTTTQPGGAPHSYSVDTNFHAAKLSASFRF